ncbi:MAG: hypothetical protein WDZ31_06130 [Phycisphaeraceae bacterium]
MPDLADKERDMMSGRPMGRWNMALAALGVLAVMAAPTFAAEPEPTDWQAGLAETAERAQAQEQMVLEGADGWLWFVPELRHLGVGAFWGERAVEVSEAANPDWADPTPAILDFHAQLERAGIELILLPVPAKAVIYPDKLPADAGAGVAEQRLDTHHVRFYERLEAEGVEVLDLTPRLLAWRREAELRGPLYCRQDTHWSGLASVFTAELLAERLRAAPWFEDVAQHDYDTEWRDVTITGDLYQMLEDPTMEKETLPLRFVTDPASGQPVEPWRESPVLLVGDSHTLVFHVGGDLHATGAGLAEQLAAELGFAPDVVGVRGSGATPSRIALLRRGDNLAGKRVVIWCFSVREFTQGQGWREVPVIRE